MAASRQVTLVASCREPVHASSQTYRICTSNNLFSGDQPGATLSQFPHHTRGAGKSINFRSLKQGDSFFLKTAVDWQTDGCTIRANTTITGEVTALELNKSGPRKTVLAVHFAPVSCSEQEGREMLPVLVAMQAPPPPEDNGLRRLGTAAFEGQQIQNLFSNPASAAAAGVKVDHETNNLQNSGTTFNANGFSGAADKQLKTGEVSGLRGIKMELPQNGMATTLVGSHDIALERHTEFVLLFTPKPSSSHEVAWNVNTTVSPAFRSRVDEAVKARVPELEEREVCAASGCTQLTAEKGQTSGSAVWTLPLAGLGFTPRLNNALYALDEDTSIHFLGEDELLFTFNLHTLVRRSAEQAGRGWRPRHIRAVVLSRTDGRVLRVEDWTASNAAGPYVWSLGGGRVLAQVGGELVTYGAGLVAQQHYVLHGPLLFVSASPGAELMLVATLHEKHTKEEHEKLAAFLGPDRLVDEDYDLTGLDGNLQLIGEKRVSAEPLQPALLRSAMVRAKPDRGGSLGD